MLFCFLHLSFVHKRVVCAYKCPLILYSYSYSRSFPTAKLRVLHQSLVHVIAPAYLRTDTAANSAADGLPPTTPPPSLPSSSSSNGATATAGGSAGIAVACAMASSGAAVFASLNAKANGNSNVKASTRVAAAVAAAGGGALAGLFVALALRPKGNNHSDNNGQGGGNNGNGGGSHAQEKAAPPTAAAAAAVPPLVAASRGKVEVVDAFLACLITDRPDGMFPTVINFCHIRSGGSEEAVATYFNQYCLRSSSRLLPSLSSFSSP